MKKIAGSISTDKTGSRCEFEFEMDDDATLEEIEEAAREAAFDRVDWCYTIDGESPSYVPSIKPASDPDCLEGPPRTREELAAEWRELNRVAPTPADKFALMLGIPEPWGFKLWQHLHHEHGLTLLESQIQEIVRLAREIDTEPDPFAGHPELPLDPTLPAYCPPRYVHGVCGTNPCSCDTTPDTPPP